MPKLAVLVLAGTDTHADMGRTANALQVANEFKQAGDEVKIVFDGAGTEWVGKLHDPEGDLNPLFEQVRDTVEGACRYCAAAFGVTQEVKAAGVPLLDDHEQHPSLRKLVVDDYQVISF